MAQSYSFGVFTKRIIVLCLAIFIANCVAASGDVVQGPRIGGLGLGIVIMMVVIGLALGSLLGCHILCQESMSIGIFLAILLSALTLVLLIIWPKVPTIETEYEYYPMTYDTTELVRIIFLVIIGIFVLVSLAPVCANDCVLEHKAEDHDFSTSDSH